MNCPKCNHEQTCPCPACQGRNPTEKPWVWVSDRDIKCGNCDFVESEDYWAELDMESYREKGNE